MKWFKNLLVLLFLFVVTYVFVQLKFIPAGGVAKLRDFPFKIFFKWLGIFSGVVCVLGLLFVVGYRLLNRADSVVSDLDIPKKPVSSTRAIAVWRKAFILGTRISCKVAYDLPLDFDGKHPLFCEVPGVIQLHNVRYSVDASGQTSDSSLRFEAMVLDGDCFGTHVFRIQTDLGEDFIRENWNMGVHEHTTLNMVNFEDKKFPISSAKTTHDRYVSKIIERREEGGSIEELADLKSLSVIPKVDDVAKTDSHKHKSKKVDSSKKEVPKSKEIDSEQEIIDNLGVDE